MLTLDDLADHHCGGRSPSPLLTVATPSTKLHPTSSGHVLLQELDMVETLDLKALGCNTAESIHCMVEAKKLAFADREAYMADPEFVTCPSRACSPRSMRESVPR